MDTGAWRAIVHGVTQSQTRLKRPSTHALLFMEQQWNSRLIVVILCDSYRVACWIFYLAESMQ